MPWYQACNFFDSIRPVYLITKIFLLHFSTLDFKQQTIHRTLLDQLCFSVAVVVDIYLIYRSITVNTPYLYLTDSVLLNVGTYLTLVFLSFMTSSISSWNCYRAVEILGIYTNIDECDQILRSLGSFIDYRKQLVFSTLYLFGWLCVPVIVTMNAVLARLKSAWTSVTSGGPDLLTAAAILRTSICFSMFVCYSTLTLLLLNARLGCVQKAMVMYLKEARISQPTVDCDVIRRIAQAHDQLCNAIQLFNGCYSIHIMHTVTMSVFFTIFVVFGLIHAYATDAGETMMQVAKTNIVYDEFYILMFVLMVVFTSLVGRNCSRVKMMINKVVCYRSYDKEVFRELRCFSQQLENHAPKINCGMLDFDWTLFYSAAGTFTTYLVILLQFDVGNLGIRHQNQT
ncbi:putative gustatory receptor 28b [Aedes albopictus]|uniref:Gustatory receptor n=1 Tax=Aedes albopictus TaxID=7160 RepID=A0ABM1ZHU2_AEDAL|nr:hypothetical protein RP20_CCG019938 [Aedes albopictus]